MKLKWEKIAPVVLRVFAVIGVLATLVIIGMTLSLWRLGSAPSEPDKVILSLDLDQAVVERSESSPLDFAMHSESIPLLDILRALDSARADASVKGLVVRFGSAQPSLAQSQEISAALARFRAGGKFAYAFGSTYGDFGGGNRAYYLASGFDNIWLQPVGSVSLTGLAIEAPFLKTALGRYGISGDFLRREEYKSVMEMFTRDNFSPPVRANMQSLIDDMADQVVEGIAAGRKWDVAKVKRIMERGPYTAEEALKLGLITHIGHADELEKEVKDKAGDGAEVVDVEDYLAYSGGARASPKAHVALIYGTGLITDHASGPADPTAGDVMGADELAGAFDAAAEDKDIKAILFRIDSPGGSPEASETIRAAMMHAQKEGKPVYVSMSSEAASGGYWIAMSADSITAEPGTITGSIGVVAGKFVIGGLMEKFGVGTDMLSTGGNAGMWSMTQEFTPEQRERMNAFLDETYRDFVGNVAAARKIPLAKMADIAKGRVFTGSQGQKLGLVDQLGGYEVTLAALRKKLNLKPDDMVAIEQFPPPQTPAEKLFRILKGIGVESTALRTALAEWHNLAVAMGPAWNGIAGFNHPITARGPDLDGIR